jgi:hypothetical protein
MATTSEARALPFFTDLFGAPLESGSIYIGQAGLDPVAYPAVVTSDLAGLVVLQQPIRTVHGRATSAGALVHMFCPIPYSILILDAAGRTVYASINETDPVVIAVGSSSVQSAADLAALRARSGASTNQVWVTGFGMYVFEPTDNISPENVPFVIVGNDGSRYHLDIHTANLSLAKISGNSGNVNSQGMWLSWNDNLDGVGRITNNQGAGAGGIVIRNVNSDNTLETGRVTIGADGSITATSGISTASTHDIVSGGNLIANSGAVALTPDGSRSLQFTAGQYFLAGSPLVINGAQAVSDANLSAKVANIMNTKAVGGLTLTTGAAPGDPGTWSAIVTGVGSTGVSMWVRTA